MFTIVGNKCYRIRAVKWSNPSSVWREGKTEEVLRGIETRPACPKTRRLGHAGLLQE